MDEKRMEKRHCAECAWKLSNGAVVQKVVGTVTAECRSTIALHLCRRLSFFVASRSVESYGWKGSIDCESGTFFTATRPRGVRNPSLSSGDEALRGCNSQVLHWILGTLTREDTFGHLAAGRQISGDNSTVWSVDMFGSIDTRIWRYMVYVFEMGPPSAGLAIGARSNFCEAALKFVCRQGQSDLCAQARDFIPVDTP